MGRIRFRSSPTAEWRRSAVLIGYWALFNIGVFLAILGLVAFSALWGEIYGMPLLAFDSLPMLVEGRILLGVSAVLGLLVTQWQGEASRQAVLGIDSIGMSLYALGVFLDVWLWDRNNHLWMEPKSVSFVFYLLAITTVIVAWFYAFVFGILFVIKGIKRMVAKIRAITLHETLRNREYDWLSMNDCVELWEEVGEPAFRLPPWSAVGTLPGQAEGDLAALIDFADTLTPTPGRSA